MSSGIRTGIIGVLCLGLGYFAGQRIASPETCCAGTFPAAVRQSGFRLINPLLECEVGDLGPLRLRYIPFEKVAKERILREVQQPHPDLKLAVYVRDLNNGPWFGINERELFSPASLLKVPLLMAFLEAAEADPAVLERSLVYDGRRESYIQQFSKVLPLQEGTAYRVDELLARMIVESDNDAKDLLKTALATSTLDRVYLDLGIAVPHVRTADDFMSVKDYASFFRILYNASYLSRTQSERALTLMTNTRFREGIVAGVPAQTVVAHKFGERMIVQQGRTVAQLHDCGIVYHPKLPYLLCVMTRGSRLQQLPGVLAQVSRIAYEEINRAHPADP